MSIMQFSWIDTSITFSTCTMMTLERQFQFFPFFFNLRNLRAFYNNRVSFAMLKKISNLVKDFLFSSKFHSICMVGFTRIKAKEADSSWVHVRKELYCLSCFLCWKAKKNTIIFWRKCWKGAGFSQVERQYIQKSHKKSSIAFRKKNMKQMMITLGDLRNKKRKN